jgi:hypothetical protein
MFKQFKTIPLKTSQKIFNFQKKNMSNNNLFEDIPTWTKRILLANTFFFGCGFIMKNSDYLSNFFYNKESLDKKRYQVLISSHFVKPSTFNFVIDTLITGLMGRYVEWMLGPQAFLKLLGYSLAFGSTILVYTHRDHTFTTTECILRSILWYAILSNPNQSFWIFPIPFQIKALYAGILLFAYDILHAKWANFGGLLAAAIIARKLI